MTFHYRAFSSDGKEISGTIDGVDESSALRILEQEGLIPIQLGLTSEQSQVWFLREISFFKNGLKDIELANIARQLSALFRSGMNASDTLQIAKLSQSKKHVIKSFGEIETRVSQGESLADAFSFPGTPFPTEFIGFLRIGDAANNITQAMQSAAIYFGAKAEVRDKVTSALVYPFILMLVGVGLLFVIGFFLVPTLLPLFRSAGVEAPRFFLLMDWVSKTLSQYWVMILGIVASLTLLFVIWKSSAAGKTTWQEIVYHVPKIGHLGYLTQLAQISRSIGLLSKSGFTLPDTFDQVADTTPSNYLSNSFRTAADTLKSGQSAIESLRDFKRLPKDFLAVVDLAERTNQWDEVLTGYADALDQQNDGNRTRLLILITPTITVMIGLLAGSLIYTVMSALLEINAIATP